MESSLARTSHYRLLGSSFDFPLVSPVAGFHRFSSRALAIHFSIPLIVFQILFSSCRIRTGERLKKQGQRKRYRKSSFDLPVARESLDHAPCSIKNNCSAPFLSCRPFLLHSPPRAAFHCREHQVFVSVTQSLIREAMIVPNHSFNNS